MRRWRVLLVQGTLLVIFLAAWEFLPKIGALSSRSNLFDSFFVSSPSHIFDALRDLILARNGSVSIWEYLWPTLYASVLGTIIGMGIGAVLGLVLSNFDFASAVFKPLVIAANATPRIALIPIIVLLFGPSLTSSIVVAVLVVLFVAFFSAYEGGRAIPPPMLENARLLGASRWSVMTSIRLPHTLAWTLTSLPLGITFAVISVVTAELLTGYPGMGKLIQDASITADAATTFAVVIVLAVVGLAVVLAADQIRNRVLHWWGK